MDPRLLRRHYESLIEQSSAAALLQGGTVPLTASVVVSSANLDSAKRCLLIHLNLRLNFSFNLRLQFNRGFTQRLVNHDFLAEDLKHYTKSVTRH